MIASLRSAAAGRRIMYAGSIGSPTFELIWHELMYAATVRSLCQVGLSRKYFVGSAFTLSVVARSSCLATMRPVFRSTSVSQMRNASATALVSFLVLTAVKVPINSSGPLPSVSRVNGLTVQFGCCAATIAASCSPICTLPTVCAPLAASISGSMTSSRGASPTTALASENNFSPARATASSNAAGGIGVAAAGAAALAAAWAGGGAESDCAATCVQTAHSPARQAINATKVRAGGFIGTPIHSSARRAWDCCRRARYSGESLHTRRC